MRWVLFFATMLTLSAPIMAQSNLDFFQIPINHCNNKINLHPECKEPQKEYRNVLKIACGDGMIQLEITGKLKPSEPTVFLPPNQEGVVESYYLVNLNLNGQSYSTVMTNSRIRTAHLKWGWITTNHLSVNTKNGETLDLVDNGLSMTAYFRYQGQKEEENYFCATYI